MTEMPHKKHVSDEWTCIFHVVESLRDEQEEERGSVGIKSEMSRGERWAIQVGKEIVTHQWAPNKESEYKVSHPKRDGRAKMRQREGVRLQKKREGAAGGNSQVLVEWDAIALLWCRAGGERATDKVIDCGCGSRRESVRQKEINMACAEFGPSLFYIDPMSSKMAPECKT